MRWLASMRQRLRSVLRPDRIDEEVRRELHFHLDRETEENIAAGMTPEAARLAAIRAVAVLTLALGIGANTAIFSVINAVLVRPLPLPAADRLVTIMENRPASEPFDGRPARRPPLPQEIRGLRSQVRSLDALYLYGGAPDIRPAGHEDAPAMRGASLSGAAMASLGARPVWGRLPSADESEVVVLSAGAWRRYFNEDRGVVGRTLSTVVGNVPSMQTVRVFTVIGVVESGFSFPDEGIDYWLAGTGPMNIARLREGVSIAVAADDISGALHRLTGTTPVQASQPQGAPRFELLPLQEQLVGRMRPVLQLFGFVVAIVLLIACANVANLLLARSITRGREIAVRAALGAGRARLIRQTLTESMLLAGIGGVIGTLLAFGGIRLLRALFANFAAPPMIRQVGSAGGPVSFPRLAEIQVDLATFLFAGGVCVTAGLLFGLAPALRHTARPSLTALRDGAASAVDGFALFRRNALRSTLVITQVSLAMTLLVAGGLLIHSLVQLLTVRKGFDPSNVLTFEVRHPRGRQSVPELRAFAEDLMVRLQTTPGIMNAAYAHDMPLIGPAQSTPLLLSPGESVPKVSGPGTSMYSPALRLVSRDFFSVTGTRVVAGRGFSGGQTPLRAIVINETLARTRFAGEDPIGRYVYLGRGDVAGQPMQIIGVVEDMRQSGLDVAPAPQVFVDFATWPGTRPAFDEPNYYAVRTSGDLRPIVRQLRHAVEQVAPGAALEQPLALADVVSSSVARPRTYAILLGLFSAIALILAIVGVYGVMTFAVAQSTRELGVRLALGARRAQVLRFVLGRAGILAGLGIGLGLLGAFGATRSLQGLLFGLSALDPVTFAASALLFGAVAMVAAFIPAHRAMRVDPLVALRYE
jgi:predicted permease